MGLIKKIKALFHEDWCTKCQSTMNKTWEQIFMLPMTVGHYISHRDAKYYRDNLVKVENKTSIPSGIYACTIKKYLCQNCGHNIVLLSVFLPVRDQEKLEETIMFQNGELDSFINSNK